MDVGVLLVADDGTEKLGGTLPDAALEGVNEGRGAAAAVLGVGRGGTKADGSVAGGSAGRGGRSKAGCSGRKAQVMEKEAGSGAAYCVLHLSLTQHDMLKQACKTLNEQGD